MEKTLSENLVRQPVDRPANQHVEQHREQDDGHGGGDGDQNNLAALTGDGEGRWRMTNTHIKSYFTFIYHYDIIYQIII